MYTILGPTSGLGYGVVLYVIIAAAVIVPKLKQHAELLGKGPQTDLPHW